MTINQLFCPCLGVLIIFVLGNFAAWMLGVIAKRSDARMEEQIDDGNKPTS